MEPMDIDKIIKDKLQENNDLHMHEMDTAKPFVWSAVQSQMATKPSLNWYHLAAAVLLLIISFPFAFYGIQSGHKKQIDLLSNKIDQLQQDYTSQQELLNTKDSQVVLLGNELKNIELKLTDVQQQQSVPRKEMIIYRTDTIYVKQVEYISTTRDPMVLSVVRTEKDSELIEGLEEINTQERRSEAIFSNDTYRANKQPAETIKIKFGSFTARKN